MSRSRAGSRMGRHCATAPGGIQVSPRSSRCSARRPVPTPTHMDAETARRAWMARALILVLGGPAAAFVPVFLAIGLPSIAGMMLLCLLPGLALLLVLRDQRRVFFVGVAITTIVTVGILIGSWLTGGINSPALIWITASPTLAVLLVGRRRAGVVTLGCILTFVVFWTLDHYGLRAPAPFTDNGRKLHLMVSGVISVAAVFTLAVIFETARISAFRALARARDAAESASRAKADFLAVMSHEIRTPITGVLGALELLDAGDEAADRDDLLRIARRSAESLLAIINDILDFSKIEAGKLTLEAAPFALADLLRDVTAALTPTAAAKGITVSASIDRTLPPAVVGDAVRLRQVLINLLGNAVKFTERGRVTLHARAHTEPGGRIRLEIEVVDTGIGIPADRLDAIFESFSQVDGSTTRRYGGTGLGLTIVKRLVTLMGGTVHVASELGVGTTFKVSLAFVPAEAAPAAPDRPVSPASAAPLPVRTVRALVAEDNTVNQMIIRHARARRSERRSGGQRRRGRRGGR